MTTDLDRARRGDLQAFNRLAEPHTAVLYRLVYRALGEPEAASTATRSGLALAARNLRQLDGDDFELWLVRCVVAACRQQVCPAVPAAAPAFVAPASPLQAALYRLPAELRLALLLVEMLGLSYAEIGTVLSLTREQVRQHVAQARWQLMASAGNVAATA